MDPIVEFVVDGMRPPDAAATLDAVMRVPPFSARVNWTATGFLRAPNTDAFASWLLEPNPYNPRQPNARRLLGHAPPSLAPAHDAALSTLVAERLDARCKQRAVSPARQRVANTLASPTLAPAEAERVRAFALAALLLDPRAMAALWQWSDDPAAHAQMRACGPLLGCPSLVEHVARAVDTLK